jgi:acetyl esterase
MSALGQEERQLLERMRAGGFKPPSQVPLEELRRTLPQMALTMAGPKLSVGKVEDIDIPGPAGPITLRIYEPQTPVAQQGVVLFFHGGGFILGSLDSEDHLCRFVCANADLPVVSVDYRLAPEHKYPSGLEDCYAALGWVVGQAAARGWNPLRIALLGGSAGGNFVPSVCRLARDRHGPVIAYQVLIVPGLALDDGVEFASRRELGSGEYSLGNEDIAFFSRMYLRDPQREALDPLVSPIRAAEYWGFPPALVVTAGFDPVRDEGAAYAERLRRANIAAEYVCFEGTIHLFPLVDGVLSAGRRAQALVAERLRRVIGTVRETHPSA